MCIFHLLDMQLVIIVHARNFNSVFEVASKIESYVTDLNKNIESLPSAARGPVSKFILPEENITGKYETVLYCLFPLF